MTVALLEKISELKDLKSIIETTAKELALSLNANCCQIFLANPRDRNSALIYESYYQDGELVERQPGEEAGLARLTIPFTLNGSSFGSLILGRKAIWQEAEIDSTRVLIARLSDLIRQAQINDIVQRETFRQTFLAEIDSLMSYSKGVGDALFMAVNILGKALQASRCLFVCTSPENEKEGWKCYEFWEQDKVKSCQEYHWPNKDSAVIAQTLTSRVPLRVQEGQASSYLTTMQSELQFSNTRSMLSLPLIHANNIYGCLIIQQCDYRRDWTVDEVDMIQSVADKIAQALANLPEEKRIHKPIMHLHQRVVPANEQIAAGVSLIQSLKGAFGQQAIPSAKEILVVGKDGNGAESPAESKIEKHKPEKSKKKSKGKHKEEQEIQELPTVEQPREQPREQQEKSWGNLDAIPTPASIQTTTSGLGTSMMPKAKAQSAAGESSLRASLHKKSAKTETKDEQEKSDGKPIEEKTSSKQIEKEPVLDAKAAAEADRKAKEKIDKALAATEQKEGSKKTSDYVFALPNIDMRTLGRINGWIEAIERKDKYLTPHAMAVAEYSCAIARAINLPEEEVEKIKLAALVHDVGKLGIASEILHKQDEELDDAELLTMMRHPMDGAALLESSPDLAPVAPLVLAHHEEFSGNGYPKGLKGEEIPLGARIIFIANSYHSMISDTQHSKGMSPEEAQKQLLAGVGSFYDPVLADAFVEYLKHE